MYTVGDKQQDGPFGTHRALPGHIGAPPPVALFDLPTSWATTTKKISAYTYVTRYTVNGFGVVSCVVESLMEDCCKLSFHHRCWWWDAQFCVPSYLSSSGNLPKNPASQYFPYIRYRLQNKTPQTSA